MNKLDRKRQTQVINALVEGNSIRATIRMEVNLYFMHYNFVRLHKSLRGTPAMAAGVTNKLWELENVLDLVEQRRRNEP